MESNQRNQGPATCGYGFGAAGGGDVEFGAELGGAGTREAEELARQADQTGLGGNRWVPRAGVQQGYRR